MTCFRSHGDLWIFMNQLECRRNLFAFAEKSTLEISSISSQLSSLQFFPTRKPGTMDGQHWFKAPKLDIKVSLKGTYLKKMLGPPCAPGIHESYRLVTDFFPKKKSSFSLLTQCFWCFLAVCFITFDRTFRGGFCTKSTTGIYRPHQRHRSWSLNEGGGVESVVVFWAPKLVL